MVCVLERRHTRRHDFAQPLIHATISSQVVPSRSVRRLFVFSVYGLSSQITFQGERSLRTGGGRWRVPFCSIPQRSWGDFGLAARKLISKQFVVAVVFWNLYPHQIIVPLVDRRCLHLQTAVQTCGESMHPRLKELLNFGAWQQSWTASVWFDRPSTSAAAASRPPAGAEAPAASRTHARTHARTKAEVRSCREENEKRK